MSGSGVRKRILVYEPSEAIGNDLAAFLGYEGYTVEQVEDPDQAIAWSHQRWYRSVILVMDIPREIRERERVVSFIDKFPGEIPIIIHANSMDFQYLEIHRIETMLRKTHNRVEVVPKAEYEQLLDSLNSFKQDTRFNYNDDLRLISDNPLVTIHQLMGILEPEISEPYESIKNEMEDLFRLTFDCNNLGLEKILSHVNGRLAIQVRAEKPDRPEEHLIAILTKRIAGDHNQHTKPVDFPKVVRQINAGNTIHYQLQINSLDGDPDWSHLRSIQAILKDRQWADAHKAIKQVNRFIVAGWQKNHARTIHVKDISETIRNHLHLGMPNEILSILKFKIQALEQSLNGEGIGMERSGNRLEIHLPEGPIILPDPVGLVSTFLKEKFSGHLIHMPGQIDLSRTLVDIGDSRVWITDLDGQGDVPMFWPETDLELALRDMPSVDIRNRYRLEVELCASEKVNPQNISSEERALIGIIQSLRESAFQNSENEQKSYQILLTYKALARFCALTFQPGLSQQYVLKHYQILILLCLNLNHFIDRNWMSYKDSLIVKDGVIRYDEMQGLFSIDKKKLEISETPKKLLQYLFNNPNKFIGYIEIARAIFDHHESYSRPDNQNLIEQIQKIKSRLQKILFSQSPDWEYFDKTARKGYKFRDPPIQVKQSKGKKKR